MKFEKFLKSVGTHGEVIAINDNEKWLVCGGVGMMIPRGVDNLLGVPKNTEFASIVHVLSNTELDDPLTLKSAHLFDAAGNAKSILRTFETALGDTVTIWNEDYGFLEKKDRLGYCEIEIPATETDDAKFINYVVVFDQSGHAIGYITGHFIAECKTEE